MSEQKVVPCVWIPCSCNALDACDQCGGKGGNFERSNEPEYVSEYNKRFTELRDAHGQRCPDCGDWLICTSDHYGGGSHYWGLVCGKCVVRFEYGTYDFELRTWPLEGKGRAVAKYGQTQEV